jgi:crotonobetainyl-CoA:carnitine CoA-transferase CaiB-like acyl-CoA transferase
VRGKTKQVGFPWMFSETPASVVREAPELGQHTEEILLELGHTWDDISELRQDGVI